MTPIKYAVALAGGQTALAKKLGVTPQAVQSWVANDSVPVKRVPAVEIATEGKVTRYMLRPDFFGGAPEAA